MKIIFVITGLGMGGAEVQVCNLANSLSKLGHNITIITLIEEAKVLPDAEVRVISLGMEKNIFSVLSSSLKLRKLINEISPDIVHAHMYHANILTRLVRIISPIKKLVCTAHNTYEGGKLTELLYRLTDRLSDITTNVSQEALELYVSKKMISKERAHLVYNGIDVKRFEFNNLDREKVREELGLSSNQTVYINVARLTEAKDQVNLLHAFNLVSDKNSALVVVGSGELEKKLRDLTSELGLSSRVFFLGMRNDVPRLLSSADIFVLSSEWEGFGLVVAEAMVNEKLVVATDCGGVKEVVAGYGALVQPKDSEMLAKSMNELACLPSDIRSKKLIAAKQHILNAFSIDHVTHNWLKLYSL
ncbi:glycosyltransferase [Vibrio vulnificus]|uniref:glycosyltransferase n=1 Tax=Vibrio vulnificus TaxID=672 RepID=UPI0009B67CED|nr:glycosyltransferase [Vibrio vulnificus]EHV5552250.1 glycosyltransferase [Vibrio vulnificus]ELP5903118.1 glycosyltransferase [Vibrio vulnificus]MCU8465649.1 glycosyltransferase [Vibrio vulnificus]OQK43046.1 putative glycosyltransferase WbdM [Vibrio vulnificus]HAS8569994.1 glycosyltransferase [Vibrio vulnificus]